MREGQANRGGQPTKVAVAAQRIGQIMRRGKLKQREKKLEEGAPGKGKRGSCRHQRGAWRQASRGHHQRGSWSQAHCKREGLCFNVFGTGALGLGTIARV